MTESWNEAARRGRNPCTACAGDPFAVAPIVSLGTPPEGTGRDLALVYKHVSETALAWLEGGQDGTEFK